MATYFVNSLACSPQIYDKYYGFSNEPPYTLDEFWVKQHASLIDKINRVPFSWLVRRLRLPRCGLTSPPRHSCKPFEVRASYTLDEFWVKQHASLIDKINRVPFTSEAASKGTAFNAVIDTLITGQLDEKVRMSRVLGENGERVAIQAELDGFTFQFPYELCREFATYYRGAIPQVRVSAILHTLSVCLPASILVNLRYVVFKRTYVRAVLNKAIGIDKVLGMWACRWILAN